MHFMFHFQNILANQAITLCDLEVIENVTANSLV